MKLKLSTLALISAFATMGAQAQSLPFPFVDHYHNNEPAAGVAGGRRDPAINPSLYMLQGYSSLWTTGRDTATGAAYAGDSWRNGAPTALGLPVLQANQAYVVQATNNRSAEQGRYAYLVDRRHQSYTAIDGLGSFAEAYRAQAGAFTTITEVGANALIGKYDDKGNGAGLQSSATVGKVVHLVNTMRGWGTSSNPSKEYFNSPRPWRLTDNFEVLQNGVESVGYYTSTLADGSPNTAAALSYLPNYQSSVKVLPELLAVRSTNPASDGGFVSGHTNAAYLASFGLAYAMPEKFQDMMLNASSMGDARIVAGMHLPLDVVGGRMLATALSASILGAEQSRDGSGVYQDMAALKASARSQGGAFVATQAAAQQRFAAYDTSELAKNRANRDLYTFRMSYGLPATNATDLAAVVPKGAEILLETRLTYLSAEQRREVLRTTAIASGMAVTDDPEGWGRLNLYAAADGYGRFDGQVMVTMDAARGGFDARDIWRNDITGSGGLIKSGSGELGLTGANSYSGGTQILGGSVLAASASALGTGHVLVASGASLVNYAPGALQLFGNYAQADGATLELVLGQGSDGLTRGLLEIVGSASIDGTLQLSFLDGYTLAAMPTYLIRYGSGSGSFDLVNVSGLSSPYQISYLADGIQIAAVPEASTWAMLLLGLGGLAVRRRRG